MRRHRVLHLGKYYPPAPGGVESHVQQLARGQASAGWDVSVLCVNHADRRGRDVTWRRYGVTATRVDDDHGVNVIRVGRSAHVARFEICPGLPAILAGLRESRFDVVHLHTPNPLMLMGAMALASEGMKFAVTHHSDVIRQKWLRHAMKPFQELLYRKAARLIVSSENYLDGSRDLAGFRSKTTVIPLGISLEPFLKPSVEALRCRDEMLARFGFPLWLSVGRCVYYKGFASAIRALRDTPGRLVIVGRGPEESRLRRLADQLAVAERVIWLHELTQDQLVGAYHAATALWFTSNLRSEAFGLVQVEAMASGCPVINMSIAGSGVAWVSRDELSGMTVAVDDSPALARAATLIASNPALRERLADGARNRAVNKFCSSRMVQQTLDVYDQILAEMSVLSRPLSKPLALNGHASPVEEVVR